jgi:hypothetical protein
VSHGEHLCQSADLIGRASSATERDLRLYHLVGALRTAGVSGPDPVAGALAVFARSTREALAAGVSSRSADELVAGLRAAGELLRSVADAGDRMQVSRRLLDVAHRLDQARGDTKEVMVPEAEPAERSRAPDAETDVVPIESLAPDVPIPSPPGGGGALETSFRTLERLERERGTTQPSIDALLGARPDAEAVAIESLCYRGRSALERAAAVRRELAAGLAGAPDLATIRPLLQELLDLVPLALDES